MMTIDHLIDMLAIGRPAGSRAERRFIRDWIAPTGAKRDRAGNLVLRIGSAPIAWLSHTDTVHLRAGNHDVRVADGFAYATGDVLGADDTTGIWLMLSMIQAKREGLYIFHRGEELGCVGSSWIAWNNPSLFAGVDYAISLDRRGYDSIVTFQSGRRTCSDAFAESLGTALGLGMVPDPTGSFTDSREYADIVPECTNLSVGYFNQHTSRERQDLLFALDLRDALLDLDASQLVSDREPGTGYDDRPGLSDWSRSDLDAPDPREFCDYCGVNLLPYDRAAFLGADLCGACFQLLSPECAS